MADLPKPPPGSIVTDHPRPDPALIERAKAFPSATVHEAAGKIGALPSGIKPIVKDFKVCGPALTVHSPGGDNLWLHRALYAGKPGDVMVAFVSDQYEYGYYGEIMAHAAQAQGISGLIIDGCVRDALILEEMNFPVFSRGLCIRGTGKDHHARGWINHPILIGGITINPGDLIIGDADGVVAIPRGEIATALDASKSREDKEAGTIADLKAGKRSVDLYGWTT